MYYVANIFIELKLMMPRAAATLTFFPPNRGVDFYFDFFPPN
jgi:hypothetical protein